MRTDIKPTRAVLHSGGLHYASEKAVVEEVHGRRPGVSIVELPAGVEAIRLAPSHHMLGAFLGGAHALQAITLGLVDASGWNPDLIRRESAPYRAAALLGDDGGW